jgi:iron complex outermembrane recepter protein
LAGSINLVPRSAFERAQPIFNYTTYFWARSKALDFKPTPGPRQKFTRKVLPGAEFSYLAPVNRQFGFTISAGASRQYTEEPMAQSTWRGGGGVDNGSTLPDTTPDRPYLTDFTVRDSPKFTDRQSFGATVDYKLGAYDRISFAYQYTHFAVNFSTHLQQFFVNNVVSFSPTSTKGAPGAGEVRLNNTLQHRENTTHSPNLVYRHDGPIWKGEAGMGYSRISGGIYADTKGFMRQSLARRTGVTVSFDDITPLRPGRITVTDAAGNPVDPYDIDNYALSTAAAGGRVTLSERSSVYADLRRDFDFRWPLTVKAGVNVRESTTDVRLVNNISYTFLGADGQPSTNPAAPGSDDGAGVVFEDAFSQRNPPHGFPKIQWVSNEKLLDLYTRNPGYFRSDPNATYRSEVNNSKRATELISAGYIRGDLHGFDRRLKLVGGFRAEQTNIRAQGPLTDPTRNFQRDANGNVRLGANGSPMPVSNVPLEVSRLTLLERGYQAEKEFLRILPNINASYDLTERLILRTAYYHSLGRPNFNQFAGGLTLPNTELPPTPSNRITVSNAGIKAWSAESVMARLEYYFERVGTVSVGVYRRDFENLFGNTVVVPEPSFYDVFGLDRSVYGDYEVVTQFNIPDTVRMQGVLFNYKQALTFLPEWARGLQVFANGSVQRATGSGVRFFAGYVPRSGSWGFSFSRQKFGAKVNWNYTSRSRLGEVTGRSIEAETYNWTRSRLSVDVNMEYYLRRSMAVFINLRNLNDPADDLEIYGPNTAGYGRFRQRQTYDSLWTVGMKGSF